MLRAVGGNECGLDFEHNQPCALEAQGRPVDYYACPRVTNLRSLLESAQHIIRFETKDGQTRFLSEWGRGNWR